MHNHKELLQVENKKVSDPLMSASNIHVFTTSQEDM